MISIQQQNDLLNVAVFGEFTLKDFQDFEANALYSMKFQGPVSVLFDLRDMHGYTLDMAWEEIRFARENANRFRRVAVVTTDQWVAWSAWVSRLFNDVEVALFEEPILAEQWLKQAS